MRIVFGQPSSWSPAWAFAQQPGQLGDVRFLDPASPVARSADPGRHHRRGDLLAEHNRQAVPPRTVSEAVQRAQRLVDHADAIDPFYAFDINIQPAAVTVAARPKGERAAAARFGVLQGRARLARGKAKAIDDFMTYGLPLTVGAGNIAEIQLSLPEGMKDLLPDGLAAQRLALGPAPNAPQVRQKARLDAVDESGRVLGSLSVTFTEALGGLRGGMYRAGLDRSGYLRLVMKVAPASAAGSRCTRSTPTTCFPLTCCRP